VGALADLHDKKKGTPTMGGIIIFISVMVSSILFARLNLLVFVALFVYASLTALGFADDYTKIVKKNSKGVSGKVKLSVQITVSLIAFALLYFSKEYGTLMRELWIPFMKYPLIETMPFWFGAIFIFFVIGGSSNALNLTDGVDGLAIGCTVSVALAYAVFSYVAGNMISAEYLFIRYIPSSVELTVICCALLGAAMSFLWYNAHPADVFMGDTGSLALGGLIGVIAFMVQQPFTLVIVGGVFVMEATSVILQVGSYKLTKKRIFRMSPIHHHFELKGWKETRVVIRFWILSLIFALAGLATLKIR
jgi:phospho-N-acetylmuramoyl-pentapeptide-transferase